MAVAAAGALVLTGRWQARPVLSGSMEPAISTGAVVLSQRVPVASVGVGDVITFGSPPDTATIVTHRVVAIRDDDGARVFTTKGDANASADPWSMSTDDAWTYQVRGVVPGVGYVVQSLRQPWARDALLVVGAVVVAYGLAQLLLPERWMRRLHGLRLRHRQTPRTAR
jgi:signal peptidase